MILTVLGQPMVSQTIQHHFGSIREPIFQHVLFLILPMKHWSLRFSGVYVTPTCGLSDQGRFHRIQQSFVPLFAGSRTQDPSVRTPLFNTRCKKLAELITFHQLPEEVDE